MYEVFNFLTMYGDRRYSVIASNPDERAILLLLKVFPRSLRPTEMMRYIPQFSSSKSSNRLFHHLQKLEAMGLINRESFGRDLSLYDITENGKEFFNKIINKYTIPELVECMIVTFKHGCGWWDLNEKEAYLRFYKAINELVD